MRTHRWKPEEISEAISLSHHYTIPQIARTMKKRPSVVRTLIQRMNPTYTKLQGSALTQREVGAMLGMSSSAISDYLQRGWLRSDIVGKRRSGFGTRHSVEWESIYDMAKTPNALAWRITDAMPPDLAAIVMETHRQWMHVDEVIAAAPEIMQERRPWSDRYARLAPVLHRGNTTHYLKSSLYEVMYQRFIRIQFWRIASIPPKRWSCRCSSNIPARFVRSNCKTIKRFLPSMPFSCSTKVKASSSLMLALLSTALTPFSLTV